MRGARIIAAIVIALGAVGSLRAQAPSTGVISGVVMSAGSSPQPIRRAILKLSSGVGLHRGAVSDDNGRFTFDALPAGTYTLSVSKPAYLTTTFGQKAAGGSTPIVLKDGERVANLRVPLTRGSVITGTVRDHLGEPVRDIQVFVSRTDVQELATLTSSGFVGLGVGTVVTDDTGTYRIYGLTPGSYLVGALPRQNAPSELVVPTRAQVDAELRSLQQRAGTADAPGTPASPGANSRAVAYAPVFHPSSTAPEAATPVSVGPGEEVRGVDIGVSLVPVGSVSGVVIGSNGQPTSAVALSLSRPLPPMPSAATLDSYFSKRPGADGTFKFGGLAPGSYTLLAKSTAQVIRTDPVTGAVLGGSGSLNDIPDGPFYMAAMNIDVNGADLNGVVLQLRLGPAMTGKVVFDTSAQVPSMNGVRLTMAPPTQAGSLDMLLRSNILIGAVQADGAFEIRGLTPGSYTFTAEVPMGASSKWWCRSAMMDGRDLLDAPLRVGDTSLSDVVVTLTDRHTQLSGTLETAGGAPASDYVIVAMPADRALWQSSRRVQAARPATNGQYSFTDLPAGDYLLVTVTDTPEDWKTADFLGSIAAAGVKVTLGEGETKAQPLRIAR